jgi:hypothetical protein
MAPITITTDIYLTLKKMKYNEAELRYKVEKAESGPITPTEKALTQLLNVLIEFLYRWFLTPQGERKSFFRALAVVLYNEFWKDLFGLKDKLDEMVEHL